MMLSGSLPVFFAAFGLALNLGAATDCSRRNAAFAPADSRFETVPSIQARRAILPLSPIEQPSAVPGARRAPIAVSETRTKKFLTPGTQPLRLAARPTSFGPLYRQPARLSTADDSRQPALVAKYQDQWSAANTVTVGRTPVLGHGGTARLNRFVFRHHPPEPLTAPAGAAPIRGTAPSAEP